MKRTLLNAVCFAVVALGGALLATPASAVVPGESAPAPTNPTPTGPRSPYEVCMDYCMESPGGTFSPCHTTCKEVAE